MKKPLKTHKTLKHWLWFYKLENSPYSSFFPPYLLPHLERCRKMENGELWGEWRIVEGSKKTHTSKESLKDSLRGPLVNFLLSSLNVTFELTS